MLRVLGSLAKSAFWNTETGNYNAGIRLIEYLRLCESLRGKDFVFFSSEKSASEEVLEFLGIEHKVAKAHLSLGKAKDLMIWN